MEVYSRLYILKSGAYGLHRFSPNDRLQSETEGGKRRKEVGHFTGWYQLVNGSPEPMGS